MNFDDLYAKSDKYLLWMIWAMALVVLGGAFVKGHDMYALFMRASICWFFFLGVLKVFDWFLYWTKKRGWMMGKSKWELLWIPAPLLLTGYIVWSIVEVSENFHPTGWAALVAFFS